jgi:hypothetical protein
MATILYPPPRPQSVGEVLDSAFRIFAATLPKCLLYSAGVVIVSQLPAFYAVMHRAPLPMALRMVRDPAWWLLLLLALVGATWLTAAVILRQYALASGRAPEARGELARGARRAPGLLLILLLMTLTVLACFLPLGVPAMAVLSAARTAAPGALPSAASILVMLVLLILASWLLVRWSCAGVVYLLTERGPLASMAQAWRLTAGSFWRLSLIYTIALLLLLVFYLLSIIVAGVISFVLGHGDVAVVTAAASVAIILLRAVVSPFYWALGLAVYGDLTARREGADLAQRLAAAAP